MSYHETKMYYIEEKQTHDVASRFGNRATLFILATWTLIDCVAPDQDGGDIYINYDDVSVTKYHHVPARQGLVNDYEDNYDVSLQHI